MVLPYRGLRAPARASILVFMALAALGAYGWTRLVRGRSKSLTTVATIVMAAALLIEFRTTMDRWLVVPSEPADVYRWLAMQPRSVVAEVPFARADELHLIHDGLYMFNSTWHWQPIVNGYSGFFPKSFIELAEETESFPDDQSIAYLKTRGVDFIVIHGSLMTPEKFGAMTATLLARHDIEAMAKFPQQMGSGHGGSAPAIVPSTARRVPRPNTGTRLGWNLWPLTLVESICCAYWPRWHSDWILQSPVARNLMPSFLMAITV